jgi:hypothetical protein
MKLGLPRDVAVMRRPRRALKATIRGPQAGTPTDTVKHRRTFEQVVGAHIGEVRYCEERGDADPADVPG